MKNQTAEKATELCGDGPVSEILILSDGKIFAHNITREMASVLANLDPADEAMNRRAMRKNTVKHELSN